MQLSLAVARVSVTQIHGTPASKREEEASWKSCEGGDCQGLFGEERVIAGFLGGAQTVGTGQVLPWALCHDKVYLLHSTVGAMV